MSSSLNGQVATASQKQTRPAVRFLLPPLRSTVAMPPLFLVAARRHAEPALSAKPPGDPITRGETINTWSIPSPSHAANLNSRQLEQLTDAFRGAFMDAAA